MLLVFDLDGTLHKSDVIYVKSFQKVYSKYTGKTLREDIIRRYIGQVPKKIWVENSNLSDEMITLCTMEVRDEMVQIIPEEAVFYNNAVSLIEELSILHNLILISNCSEKYLDAISDKFDLKRYFKGIIATESYDYLPKEEILKALQIIPDIVIGDSGSDYKIAKELNTKFIYCEYGYGNLPIHGVKELIDIKKNLS